MIPSVLSLSNRLGLHRTSSSRIRCFTKEFRWWVEDCGELETSAGFRMNQHVIYFDELFLRRDDLHQRHLKWYGTTWRFFFCRRMGGVLETVVMLLP